MNRIISTLLKYAVSAGIIYILLVHIPYQEVIKLLKTADKGLIVVALLVSFFPYIVGTLRWKILLKQQGVLCGYKELFLIGLASLFFNLFFPSLIASDVFRTIAISAKGKDSKKIFSTVFMDRFSGLVGMGLLATMAYLFGRHTLDNSVILVPLLVFVGIIAIVTMVVFSKRFFNLLMGILKKQWKITRKLHEVHDQLYFFKKEPRTFQLSVWYSLVIQLFAPLACYYLFRAFGTDIDLITVYVILPIVLAISSIPITISGLGTREAAMVYFFLHAGVLDKEVPLAVSLFLFFFSVVAAVAGGIVYVVFYHRWVQSHKNPA